MYGTLGYGKSYILAAVVCLLRKQGRHVLYIANCDALEDDFDQVLANELVMADCNLEAGACVVSCFGSFCGCSGIDHC